MARNLLVAVALWSYFAAMPFVEAADYVLCQDCSRSMSGDKLSHAKAGAQLFVAMLDDQASLQIVAFDSDAKASPSFRMDQPGQRDAAIRWIGNLSAEGGTDYLAALRAVIPSENGTVVFLSDGQHGGSADEVLDELRRRFVGKVRLCSIGVECASGSPAEQLLSQMAAMTGGSFSRVEKSDQLVSSFAEIAIRSGRFRTHRPTETDVRFRAGHGRVLALGFDGQIDVTAGASLLKQRSHQADLPGEDVTLRAIELNTAGDLRIQLNQPKTKAARIAEIHRDDLPSAQLTLNSKQGRVAAGGSLDATISFEQNGAAVHPQQVPGLSAGVEIRDSKGRVLKTVPAKLSDDKKSFQATIDAPTKPGAVTLRSISKLKTPEGQEFVDQRDVTVIVEQAKTLLVKPGSLSEQVKTGSFAAELELAIEKSKSMPSSASARFDKEVAGLSLIQTKYEAG